MKKIIFTMLAFVMLLASCSKGPKTASYIPNDAMVVVNLNVKQLLDKADAKNIDNISFVKLARQELRNENAELATLVDDIIANPTSTGLDLREDIVYFMNEVGDGAIIIPMHKESTFEKFLNDLTTKNGLTCNITKEDGYTTADMDITLVTYNGDVAIIPINANNPNKFAKGLFGLDNEKSLAKNKNYKAHWKGRSEMGFWMDMNNLLALAEQFGSLEKMGIPKEYLDEMRKGGYSCNLLFDKGAIRFVVEAHGISSKLIKEFKQDFNGKLINYMPEQCLGTLAYGVKTDWIAEIMDNSGEFDMEEPVLGEKNLKEIINAFGGSFLLNIFDITTGDNGIMPMMALAADIKDAALVREVLESFGLEKSGDMYVIPDLGIGDLMVGINDKVIYVTNATEAASQFANGGYKNAMKAVASRAKKGNYLYVDLNLSHYPTNIVSLIPDNLVQLLSNYLDYTECSSSSDTKAEWSIYLAEKKENSLLATLHFVDNNLIALTNLTESLGSGLGNEDDDELEEYYVEDVDEE